MKTIIKESILTILMITTFLVVPASYANNEYLETHHLMKVERVIDGDTFVASGRKIRLWGIDTPEKNEPFFMEAKKYLETILTDGDIRCKFIEKDRYKRDVMHCLRNDDDIGSIMVQLGLARDYSKYSGDYYQLEEEFARSKKRGIWGEKSSD